MYQIHHIRLLLSDYCIKIHAPIIGDGIPGKTSQEWSIVAFVLAWRQFLRPADVKNIFDQIREPKLVWNDCLVTKTKKKQKIVEKNKNKKKEKKRRFWNFDVFPLILRYRRKRCFWLEFLESLLRV